MRLLFLMQILFLLCFGSNAKAQDPNYKQIDCNDLIETDIEYDLEPFGYSAASSCSFMGGDCFWDEGFMCRFQLAQKMADVCEITDWLCINENLLISTTIDIQTSTDYHFFPYSDALVDTFPQVLNAYKSGDFETALSLLEDQSNLISFQPPVLYLSRGLLYEMLNQPNMALTEYALGLEKFPQYVLLHYTRGLFLGRLGRVTEASFETAWVEDFLSHSAPDLLPIAEPLTHTYPLDTSRFSTWMKYPVMAHLSGQGGENYYDGTQREATSVQIGIYDELDVILAIDIDTLRSFSTIWTDGFNTYVLQKVDSGVYNNDFANKWGPDIIQLEFKNGLIYGNERRFDDDFILAPPDYPDPRETYGKPICEGGVISRLRPGMYVTDTSYFSGGFNYVEAPGDEIDRSLYFDYGNGGKEDDWSTYPLLEVNVTDNYVCLGTDLWWEVTDGQGNFGWQAENIGNEYQINPLYNLRDHFDCLNSPTTRLFNEGEGFVIEGFGANNLRVEPTTDAELIGQIPEGGQFSVLDGPICADEMAWWQVDYNGVIGWTAEGNQEAYWLEPILSD